MGHGQGLHFYFIRFSKRVKQAGLSLKSFNCLNSELFAEQDPKALPESPAFKPAGEAWGSGGRRRAAGGRRGSGEEAAALAARSQGASFPEALAWGQASPHFIHLTQEPGWRHGAEGKESPGSRLPLPAEEITRRFSSREAPGRGTRVWRRAARAPRMAPAVSLLALRRVRGERCQVPAVAALPVGGAQAPLFQPWGLGRRPVAGGMPPDVSSPARAGRGELCASAFDPPSRRLAKRKQRRAAKNLAQVPRPPRTPHPRAPGRKGMARELLSSPRWPPGEGGRGCERPGPARPWLVRGERAGWRRGDGSWR